MSGPRGVPLALFIVFIAGWYLIATGTVSVSAEHGPEAKVGERAELSVLDQRLLKLTGEGYPVTEGAAAGYLEDSACMPCHTMFAEPYQEVGMARAFASAEEAERIEDFAAEPFFHAASGRYYEMRETGDGGLRFRRWQLDGSGRRVNALEQDVDWVMGSGQTSRVYIYRTPSGELFQLPLAWYTQDGGHWALAPGLDKPHHDGVLRRVRRECMFCHNAYPEVPTGSDAPGAPHTFPEQLPQGIGCQRCHGPGSRHVATARFGGSLEEIRSKIISPKKLDSDLSRDVCYTCHMQPSVAMMPVRRFGRADYSQRPGEPLSDYLLQTDATIDDLPKSERFEINHHPYRLEQSACFTQSLGEDGASALSCLTCHDPHRKVPVAERAAHYRRACTSCHQVEDCDLEAMREVTAASLAGLDAEQKVWLENQDCAGCHMPRRRTQDVVHVVMTDHRITRRPAAEDERLAPLEEAQPGLVTVELLRPDEAPAARIAEIHRARAVLQAGGGAEALERLDALLAEQPIESPEAWLAKARAELLLGRYEAAEQTAIKLLELMPDSALVYRFWGIAASGRGQTEAGLAMLRRAVDLDRGSHENVFNYGVLLARAGQEAEAEAHLRRAIELRPHAAPAHRHLARVLHAQGRTSEAEEAYRLALAAEPADGESTLALGRLLLEEGRRAEGLGVLRHGALWARRPAPIEALLAAETGAGP